MKGLRWLLPLLSLVAVLWFTWQDVRHGRTGPGPLHTAHAAVAELRGGANCEACHRSGAGIDDAGCVRCHAAIGAQREAGTGLHGQLDAAAFARCERCHSEHHGDVVPLVALHAFARVGVPDAAAYDHRHVAFSLTGAHTGLACTRCHPHGNDVAPPAGGRYLGLQQACTSCHDDAHRGAFGGDCAGCHGQERAWREAPGFAHAAFPLAGAHQAVHCVDCHPTGTQFDVAAERAAAVPARTCGQCHADPHGGTPAPAALRLRNTAECARCHPATAWAAARPTVDRHAELGFALRGAHATASCESCHGRAEKAARWPSEPPTSEACGACHSHPHRPELVALATVATGPADGCAGCHGDADASFAAGRVTAAQHQAIGFPLEPPHADVACAKCHAAPTWAERYPGRSADDCRSCHVDVHGGQFAHDERYAQCTACHAATQFVPHRFGLAAHAASAFPLTGAHEAVGCAACHAPRAEGGRLFHGTPSTCSSCHRDVHRGAFDRAGRPRRVGDRSDCARCHDTAAFTPVVGDFDHATWTGYDLVGAHALVACVACHPGAGPGQPRLGRAAGTRCAACHQDPHVGQFDAGGGTDCTRCHAATQWSAVQFDHATMSRFPLDATHAKVPCSRCHVAYEVGAAKVVRYKPLGVTCGDCHRLGRNGEVRR